MKRPNIILTIADDQRGSALGCAGVEPVITPFLDRLAGRGLRFGQAQHLGSCHGAVCAPSRAMLHTGRPYFHLPKSLLMPWEPGAGEGPALPATLGGRLQEAGYDCFATGKWHNGGESFQRSFNRGENVFFGGMNDHWFTPVHDHRPDGAYLAENARLAAGFSTEVFARSAVDYIRSRAGSSEPFFCYCAFTAPHDPRTPPDTWRRRYRPATIALPENCRPRFFRDDSPAPPGVEPTFDNGSLEQRDELTLGTPRPAAEIRRSLAEYYGMISHMDEWIGRIHAAAEEIGALENTLVIHTADPGLALGQHGFLGKQNLYQHSLGVPLILAGPGIPKGTVSDALCYQHDLFPTLLEMAGLRAEAGPFRVLPTDGRISRESIGAAFSATQRSLRTPRHKLIVYRLPDGPRTELFDLSRDPFEVRNLAEEDSEAVRTLREELVRWQGEVGDDPWF